MALLGVKWATIALGVAPIVTLVSLLLPKLHITNRAQRVLVWTPRFTLSC